MRDTEERIRPDVAAKFAPLRDMLRAGTGRTHLQPLQAEDWRVAVRRLIESAGDVDLSK